MIANCDAKLWCTPDVAVWNDWESEQKSRCTKKLLVTNLTCSIFLSSWTLKCSPLRIQFKRPPNWNPFNLWQRKIRHSRKLDTIKDKHLDVFLYRGILSRVLFSSKQITNINLDMKLNLNSKMKGEKGKLRLVLLLTELQPLAYYASWLGLVWALHFCGDIRIWNQMDSVQFGQRCSIVTTAWKVMSNNNFS